MFYLLKLMIFRDLWMINSGFSFNLSKTISGLLYLHIILKNNYPFQNYLKNVHRLAT